MGKENTGVFLRPLRRDDAMTSWQWRNDPSIWEFTGSRPNIQVTPEIELEWIDRVIADPTSLRFAICIESSHEYIGNIYLTDISDGTAELHVFIGASNYWGMGLATHAVSLCLNHAQVNHIVKSVYLHVHREHASAIRIYTKCGFKPIPSDSGTKSGFMKMQIVFA